MARLNQRPLPFRHGVRCSHSHRLRPDELSHVTEHAIPVEPATSAVYSSGYTLCRRRHRVPERGDTTRRVTRGRNRQRPQEIRGLPDGR
ncbi:hypothetical protein SAMN04487904_105215 [Actinopolyspora lacussalsi subsp. righensis]|uniref:Uncharacterized protein n=1 Tax=Actinopolyspora righensis TaxID=995060 RepID=A0A1I6ZV56_9ACTN|nr:hypothetical protein SAMN04487904_105215 [Actinopolyspora righensis]